MASIRILNDKNNQYYTVNVDLNSAYLSDGNITPEYYLVINTSIPKADNTQHPSYYVKTLNDVPPGYIGPAVSFTELLQWYVAYFVDAGNLTQSSSSSSLSSSSLSNSSSSTSDSSSEVINSSSSISSFSSISSISSILINSTSSVSSISSISSVSSESSESSIEINSTSSVSSISPG